MNVQLHKLFHTLWTKAVGTIDYDKEEWKALERMLDDQEPAHITLGPGRTVKITNNVKITED